MAKSPGKNRTHIRPHRGLEMKSHTTVRTVSGTDATRRGLVWCSLVMLPVFAWAYAPTWSHLANAWEREADYSHGWLVVPLAIFFLWLRRSSFPANRLRPSVWGMGLLLASLAFRWLAARFYIEPVDAWAMILWLGGWFWLMGGYALFRWMLPALGFLFFMVPLPYRLESILSVPLQEVATQLSCFLLQLLGQPAFAEGTTILLGDQPLQVEQACSGLRIFVGILALAVATLMLSPREWWERTLLVFAVVPIALISNATRIVITGLLYRHVSSEAARHFSHDLAGWLMILFAAGLFLGAIWYLNRLMPLIEYSTVMRGRRGASLPAPAIQPDTATP